MKELTDGQREQKAVEIAKICDGLNLFEIKQVLDLAYYTMREGCRFSTSSPQFKKKIKTDFYALSQLLSEDPAGTSPAELCGPRP